MMVADSLAVMAKMDGGSGGDNRGSGAVRWPGRVCVLGRPADSVVSCLCGGVPARKMASGSGQTRVGVRGFEPNLTDPNDDATRDALHRVRADTLLLLGSWYCHATHAPLHEFSST